jgi:hypothetical protein
MFRIINIILDDSYDPMRSAGHVKRSSGTDELSGKENHTPYSFNELFEET